MVDEEVFTVEVGKEYSVEELLQYVGEFVLIYNGKVIVCPCDDDIDKEVVEVEKIEEVDAEGDKIFLVWVR